jgi:serine/threonine-protein kinase
MKQCPDCQKEFKEHLLFCPFDGHALASKSEPDRIIGTILDNKYRIEEKIGQGGMGKVYRATHIHMDHTVAIKVLHSELSSDQIAMERFRREARAAAQIHHQNAVAVTDFGVTVDDTVAYLVMEFLEGLDLGQRIKQSRQMRIAEAFYITRQICAALHAAHGKGIIHRDLKPDNVMIDGEGDVFVLDFGLARAIEDFSLTHSGVIVGSPYYMSPEQLEGTAVDERTDVFSLGLILYYSLTGADLFAAESITGVLARHAANPVNDAVRNNASIPPHLQDLLISMLEENRDRRTRSAREILERLTLRTIVALGIAATGEEPAAVPTMPIVKTPPPEDSAAARRKARLRSLLDEM